MSLGDRMRRISSVGSDKNPTVDIIVMLVLEEEKIRLGVQLEVQFLFGLSIQSGGGIEGVRFPHFLTSTPSRPHLNHQSRCSTRHAAAARSLVFNTITRGNTNSTPINHPSTPTKRTSISAMYLADSFTNRLARVQHLHSDWGFEQSTPKSLRRTEELEKDRESQLLFLANVRIWRLRKACIAGVADDQARTAQRMNLKQ
ncbi:hypothetical protein DFH29DRAFT_880372 [Suillus ampliporus]|nr:hypothetical protein DFH29DRAFT_880372 [Suillus ampliporus]